jgi:hypothetical protein
MVVSYILSKKIYRKEFVMKNDKKDSVPVKVAKTTGKVVIYTGTFTVAVLFAVAARFVTAAILEKGFDVANKI